MFVRNKEVIIKYKVENTKKQHCPKSRENVFVRNKEVNTTNTIQTKTKQHSPKSRIVRNKEVNMTTKTNRHKHIKQMYHSSA